MRQIPTLGLLLLLSLDLSYAEAQSDSAATLVLGRRYTQLFYADSLDPIWAAMTPEMQKVLGKEAGLEAFRTQVTEEIGLGLVGEVLGRSLLPCRPDEEPGNTRSRIKGPLNGE